MKKIYNANTEDVIRDLDQFIFYNKSELDYYVIIAKYKEHYFKMEICLENDASIKENKVIDKKCLLPEIGSKIFGGFSTKGYRLFAGGIIINNKLSKLIMNGAKIKLREVKLNQIL
jgi:hypothetical protein